MKTSLADAIIVALKVRFFLKVKLTVNSRSRVLVYGVPAAAQLTGSEPQLAISTRVPVKAGAERTTKYLA